MELDILQLPIPDWGLECPGCHYPLRGLPSHRCPECGRELDMAALVQPWVRVRPPRFTGAELPVPDYGLRCGQCRVALAGAPSCACRVCGTAIDLEAWRPRSRWYDLGAQDVAPLIIPGVESLLAAEYVPHIPASENTIRELYTGSSPLPTRLCVLSEFYFEVLWLLQAARRNVAAARSGRHAPWRCARCGEENPGHFELCWQCERPRRGGGG
jgi:predicted amidophosphoribosyltransferase